MSLERIDARPCDVALPSPIKDIIELAWDQTHRFMHKTRRRPVKGFQPSEFEEAYNWLTLVRSEFPPDRKPRFCEWGSGLGVVSVLAERLGFEATAIESDTDLYRAGLKWQESVGAEVNSIHGSFVPSEQLGKLEGELQRGLLGSTAAGPDSMRLDLETKSVFDTCGVKPDSFEVIYAYPWPSEEAFLFRLFELVVKPGTFLVTFHSAADFRLHRKKGQA